MAKTETKGAQLDTAAAAEAANVARGTIQRLRHRDRVEPRTYPEGHQRAGKLWYRFPPPDGYIGNQPWWYEATIAAHLAELRPPHRPAQVQED